MSVGATPEILPVNFAVVDGAIVFRTGVGTKLHAATSNAVLAFEIDGSDGSSGWSVLVVGQSSEVTESSQITTILAALPDGWVPGDREHIVRITPARVSGRRIHRPAQP